MWLVAAILAAVALENFPVVFPSPYSPLKVTIPVAQWPRAGQ
jgi:hypothetical protein